MGNTKEYGRKISSLKNMQKVTKAMNMISSIKLRKIYSLQDSLKIFSSKTDDIPRDILSCSSSVDHPAVNGFVRVDKVHLVMFTADRGLCGTHNSSVIKAVENFLVEQKSQNTKVEITSIGFKGAAFCRRKALDIYNSSVIAENKFSKKDLSDLSERIFKRFLTCRVQRVYVVGNIFYSALHQETELIQLMPLSVSSDEGERDKVDAVEMHTEPSGLS